MVNRVRVRKNKSSSIIRIVFLIGMLFVLTSTGGKPVKAQSGEDGWSLPENLSHSGASSNPAMVMDANGVIHVIWLDNIEGMMYTKREAGNWSSPVPVQLRFGKYKPTLVADSKGNIHAFWKDAVAKLYYSRVMSSNFVSIKWSLPTLLAFPVIDFDVVVDSADNIHLAYLQTRNTSALPAGVYYQNTKDGGKSWLFPVLLYQSLYFRALKSAEANVQIATGDGVGNSSVYVAWDNRPRGKIFLMQSSDGGQSWTAPKTVNELTESENVNPRDIHVGIDGDKIFLVWQSKMTETNCEINYQWSVDKGASWQPHQQIDAPLIGCLSEIQVLKGNDGLILLLRGDQVALLAWDGKRWSDPQVQDQMNSIIDPESQLPVNLGNYQANLVGGNNLYVVGGDQTTNGDIWWMERKITGVDGWFPQDSVWDPLAPIARSGKDYLSLAMVADSTGRPHVFWSQSTNADDSNPDTALYYTRQEENKIWARPVAILNSPEGSADKPTVAISTDDRLLLAWRRGELGQVFFSQALANVAIIPSEWSVPLQISPLSQAANSPCLQVDLNGKIYVIYSVPVNEGRGIYLTRSEDGGRTWQAPKRVFDSALEGWEMVDQPQLAIGETGILHALWKRYTLASRSPVTLSLLYSHSTDGGVHWSDPEVVTDKPVEWIGIAESGGRIVHRLWQEYENSQTIVWDEQTLDNGQTWYRNSINSSYNDIYGLVSLISDKNRNMQLLQVVKSTEDHIELQHMQWDSQQWRREPSLDLSQLTPSSINGLVAALSRMDKVEVIIHSKTGINGSEQQDYLYFSQRSMVLAKNSPVPLSVPVATSLPTSDGVPTLEPTVQPTLTPTIDLSVLNQESGNGTMENSYTGLVYGGLVAAVVVAILLALSIWLTKRFQR